MRKNILLISVRSDFGGGPKHVDLLINNIGQGYNVFIASPLDEPFGLSWRNNKVIKDAFDLKHRQVSFFTLFKLIGFIRTNNIHIIHSHGKGAGIYSRLIKVFLRKKKVVHTFHGFNLSYGIVMNMVHKIVERTLSVLTDRFVCVSKGELESVCSNKINIKNKTEIIYNGIKDPKIKSTEEHELFTIVTLSRFDYQKNMDLCYDIANELSSLYNCRFVWIGDGDDKERLEEKSRSNNLPILFTGFSEKPLELLSPCDIVLSTSRFEGLPYALVEACAMSKPIIATNVVGNNEVVDHCKNGFLFTKKNEAVEYIGSLIENGDLLKEMGIHSREYFEEKFTLKKMISSIERVYGELT